MQLSQRVGVKELEEFLGQAGKVSGQCMLHVSGGGRGEGHRYVGTACTGMGIGWRRKGRGGSCLVRS